MRKRILVSVIGTCVIVAGILVGCSQKNNVAATENPGMERVANMDDGNRTITTYVDREHSKLIYVVQNKNNNAGISITAVDLK